MADASLDKSFKIPYCPFYGSNVVISEYNENGECKCLSCNPFTTKCSVCEYRDELINKRQSMVTNRCLQCIQQK